MQETLLTIFKAMTRPILKSPIAYTTDIQKLQTIQNIANASKSIENIKETLLW